MTSRWVKSLQCKSISLDDIYAPNPKSLLPSSSNCRSTVQGLKDVITIQRSSSAPESKPKPKSKSKHQKERPRPLPPMMVKFADQAVKPGRGPDVGPVPLFPGLTELPDGHPSRNVVEIIFRTRWGPKKPFPGLVEMVFKIRNSPRAVARFEDYRETVKRRAEIVGRDDGPGPEEGADMARCVADGNEMMRFQCVGSTSGVIGGDGMWAGPGQKGSLGSAYSFDGSGAAHDSVGGVRGTRAILVCRVIAGRVGKGFWFGPSSGMDGRVRVGFDSVSGEDGELLVFDSRAVLPCFLVIYKLYL